MIAHFFLVLFFSLLIGKIITIISYLFLHEESWSLKKYSTYVRSHFALNFFTIFCAFVLGMTLYISFIYLLPFLICFPFFISYTLFFSLLLISTHTDLEAMVIPSLFSLWMAPVGILFAYFNALFISVEESIISACAGYAILWLLGFYFKKIRKKKGIGEGDMELMALIGAFLGLNGVIYTLLYGSLLGIIAACIYLYLQKKDTQTPIPFGPFLALGAYLYFLQTISNMCNFF